MNAPIIVSAVFGDADHAWLDGLRQIHYPRERNRLAAHLTLFHHLPPSLECELRSRLLAETRGCEVPAAELSGLIDLGGGVAFRVHSPALEAIRTRLAEAFFGSLTPQDSAGWRPHVTIQNKVDVPVARALLKKLDTDFRPRPVKIAGLAAYHYRGGPWEPIARYPFR